MKKIILLSFLIVISLFISSCGQQVTCNRPYILVGENCCLDVNGDNICDDDEKEE